MNAATPLTGLLPWAGPPPGRRGAGSWASFVRACVRECIAVSYRILAPRSNCHRAAKHAHHRASARGRPTQGRLPACPALSHGGDWQEPGSMESSFSQRWGRAQDGRRFCFGRQWAVSASDRAGVKP